MLKWKKKLLSINIYFSSEHSTKVWGIEDDALRLINFENKIKISLIFRRPQIRNVHTIHGSEIDLLELNFE